MAIPTVIVKRAPLDSASMSLNLDFGGQICEKLEFQMDGLGHASQLESTLHAVFDQIKITGDGKDIVNLPSTRLREAVPFVGWATGQKPPFKTSTTITVDTFVDIPIYFSRHPGDKTYALNPILYNNNIKLDLTGNSSNFGYFTGDPHLTVTAYLRDPTPADAGLRTFKYRRYVNEASGTGNITNKPLTTGERYHEIFFYMDVIGDNEYEDINIYLNGNSYRITPLATIAQNEVDFTLDTPTFTTASGYLTTSFFAVPLTVPMDVQKALVEATRPTATTFEVMARTSVPGGR